eukprot:TRINITY_DN8848_c0_g2_i2.p1 TRINITY_DN8848_c0_g2~~TRINITY_DN8848_c0_g2_i2.p1  ORF type:complete len:195 (-),score=27.25 TRINITY_DN8848_c0_g2_i2:870-1454(-)
MSIFNHRLFLRTIHTIQSLLDTITYTVRPLLRVNSIKVIVIDSITALFRAEYAAKDQASIRAGMLHQHAKQLKSLSDEFGIPLLTINQVTDDFTQVGYFNPNNSVKPALGLFWTNSVNMRIILSKTQRVHHPTHVTSGMHTTLEPPVKRSKYEGVQVRTMKIALAPHLPNRVLEYFVDNSGLVGIGDPHNHNQG